jgi:hypothetical protein
MTSCPLSNLSVSRAYPEDVDYEDDKGTDDHCAPAERTQAETSAEENRVAQGDEDEGAQIPDRLSAKEASFSSKDSDNKKRCIQTATTGPQTPRRIIKPALKITPLEIITAI